LLQPGGPLPCLVRRQHVELGPACAPQCRLHLGLLLRMSRASVRGQVLHHSPHLDAFVAMGCIHGLGGEWQAELSRLAPIESLYGFLMNLRCGQGLG
jgi:hypothetical protein